MANAWFEVGKAIRNLIVGSQKRRSPGRPARSSPRPTSVQRGGRSHNESSHDEPLQESPGQFGDGQTRDLTRSEISRVRLEYAPNPDGDPDPGEIVWTWVPYVENDGRGKDRPVLIIGRIDATTVVGCYLSTKQHHGFVSIGSGAWDSQGRESYLSPERLLRITHDGMRREGVQIDKAGFSAAVSGVQAHHQLR
ncbi:MAG: type II toxin-antitoxin system PemK/MazF family toxin [Leucobacter sp.]